MAAYNGDLGTLRTLLSDYPNCNVRDSEGNTALHCACTFKVVLQHEFHRLVLWLERPWFLYLQVVVNWGGRGKWYYGRISRDRGDGTYDIVYEDGMTESAASGGCIKLVDDGRLQEGDRVEVDYGTLDRWYLAKIVKNNHNGTFDIMYDHDELEANVPENRIKVPIPCTDWCWRDYSLM